jgi:hypothetical protein
MSGHPRRAARRARAAERLERHTYRPGSCGPNCPKKSGSSSSKARMDGVASPPFLPPPAAPAGLANGRAQ